MCHQQPKQLLLALRFLAVYSCVNVPSDSCPNAYPATFNRKNHQNCTEIQIAYCNYKLMQVGKESIWRHYEKNWRKSLLYFYRNLPRQWLFTYWCFWMLKCYKTGTSPYSSEKSGLWKCDRIKYTFEGKTQCISLEIKTFSLSLFRYVVVDKKECVN